MKVIAIILLFLVAFSSIDALALLRKLSRMHAYATGGLK